MACLVVTFTLKNIRRDAGRQLAEGGDGREFLLELRRVAEESLEAVPSLRSSVSIGRLRVSMRFSEENAIGASDESATTGRLDVETRVLIDSDVAYEYRTPGSAADEFVQTLFGSFGAAFQSLPNNGGDFAQAIGMVDDDQQFLSLALEIDSPQGIGRPLED